MGIQQDSSKQPDQPVPVSKESSSAGKSSSNDASTVKLPFRIMNYFIQVFSHLENTLTEEFAQKLCE